MFNKAERVRYRHSSKLTSNLAMADEVESKIVSQFLLNTCRLRQPCSIKQARAAVWCVGMLSSVGYRQNEDDEVIDHVPSTTGSVAEFYVQPMLSCINDVDTMFYRSDELAIPEGNPPPTELSAEFNSRVKVHEVIDSEFPGYVYLVLSYLLTEDLSTCKYTAAQYDRRQCVAHDHRYDGFSDLIAEIHGPATRFHVKNAGLVIEFVSCIRCLVWPSQAADWPTRRRNYDWPDSATVDRVVNNGCDVVRVAHRRCRQEKWKGKHQFRLSFSRAEIILLGGWIQEQQVVYHMLRFFFKNERLTDKDADTFSNYHVKTLMLWACEWKPRGWWTGDVNVVRICVDLLHILADWLKNKSIPHYFIQNYNLSYGTAHSEKIADQLMSITESWLSKWFVNNYLQKCAELCPDRISKLFRDVSTSTRLQNAVLAIADWRRDNALKDLWNMYISVEFDVLRLVTDMSLSVRSCICWINELVKIDSSLRFHFTAVAFLHIANKIAKHSLSDQLLDVLATLVEAFAGKSCYSNQPSSALSLTQAVTLMKVAANNPRSDLYQLKVELSKAYLHRALRCKDFGSDSIYCLANVYLAVLYYTTGQYQTAIDHCTLVMRPQDHSQCSSHVVQGELLPKIDDGIDTVLGLAVFYHYVRAAELDQKQTEYAVVLSPELLAQYLYLKCLPATECYQLTEVPPANVVVQPERYVIVKDQLYIADVLLLKSMHMSLELHETEPEPLRKPITNATGVNTSELIELLQHSAVELMSTYRQLTSQQFGSFASIVTTDFEALYAFKRGDYRRCLQLSTQNVQTLLYVDPIPVVSTFPEYIQLLDSDIVSLIAMTLIVNPTCRYDNDHASVDYISISQLTLSLYLMTRCQLKLHHRTSLAETLDWIEVAQKTCPDVWTFEHLTLKLIERKVHLYLSTVR